MTKSITTNKDAYKFNNNQEKSIIIKAEAGWLGQIRRGVLTIT